MVGLFIDSGPSFGNFLSHDNAPHNNDRVFPVPVGDSTKAFSDESIAATIVLIRASWGLVRLLYLEIIGFKGKFELNVSPCVVELLWF
jgi:hypothetical protein